MVDLALLRGADDQLEEFLMVVNGIIDQGEIR